MARPRSKTKRSEEEDLDTDPSAFETLEEENRLKDRTIRDLQEERDQAYQLVRQRDAKLAALYENVAKKKEEYEQLTKMLVGAASGKAVEKKRSQKGNKVRALLEYGWLPPESTPLTRPLSRRGPLRTS